MVDVVAAAAPAQEAAVRRQLPETVRRVLAPVLLVLLAFTLVSLHVGKYTEIGPIDELQHIDYLVKAPHVVVDGERVGQQAMEEEACRGLDFPLKGLPDCAVGEHYDPSDFQEAGYNTASVNTPLYYTITKAFGWVLSPFTPGDSIVTDGRMAGAVWLALGLVLAYAVGRRIGVPRTPLFVVLVLVACTPSVLFLSSTVNPDAACLAVGAGAVLATLWWEGAPTRRWPVLVAAVAVGVLLKATNVIIFVAIGCYVLLRLVDWWRGRRAGREDGLSGSVTEGPKGLLVGGAAILGTFVVVQLAWAALAAVVASSSTTVPPMAHEFAIGRFPQAHAVEAVGLFLNPLASYLVEVGPGEYLAATQRLTGILLMTALVAVAVFGRTQGRVRTLAQGAALVGLLGAPAFVALSYFVQGVYFAPPPRYGQTLVPIMAVLAAYSLRTRAMVRLVAAGAAVMFVLTVYRLVAF